MKKMRQDNDMTDRIGSLYAENETHLLWPIWQGMVYDKDEIGQWRDWSERCGLHQNRN